MSALPRAVVIGLLVAAVVLGVVFYRQQRGAREPMMPLDLWRNRVIATCNLGALAVGSIMMGVTLVLPIFVQGVMGQSPLAAGLVIGAMSIGWPAATTVSGWLMTRTSYRAVAVMGALILIVGSVFLLFLTTERGPVWAGGGAAIIGVGMGFTTIVFLISIQSGVSWEQRGAATSSNVFMRMLGQVVGAALYGAILNYRHQPPGAQLGGPDQPVDRAGAAPWHGDLGGRASDRRDRRLAARRLLVQRGARRGFPRHRAPHPRRPATPTARRPEFAKCGLLIAATVHDERFITCAEFEQ